MHGSSRGPGSPRCARCSPEELHLLDRLAGDGEAWERAYDLVRAAVTLRYPDGREVPEFLLHVNDDGEAWWRWHDKPFRP